jgi:hypothetical protein
MIPSNIQLAYGSNSSISNLRHLTQHRITSEAKEARTLTPQGCDGICHHAQSFDTSEWNALSPIMPCDTAHNQMLAALVSRDLWLRDWGA